MLTIDVRTEFAGVFRALDLLDRDVQAVATMTLNKVAGSVKTETARRIARETGMKVREVSERIPITRATRFNLTAAVRAEPWSPNLIRYGARQTKQGVSAAAWRKRKVYRGAFIGNKGRTVFTRTSRARLPIKALHGPSIPRTFIQAHNLAAIRDVVTTRFPLEYERAMRQRMRQHGLAAR